MQDQTNKGVSVKRLRAEGWNLAGRVARLVADLLNDAHLWLYGKSGEFDARSDEAGYWDHHTTK